MRILHVLDTCGAGGMETTFLNVLRRWHSQAAWADHEILATAGGALEPALRQTAARVVIAATPEAVMTTFRRGYDVVHFLVDRMACRWIPIVAGHCAAALVYGKGYDMAGTFRLNDQLRWQPDESIMWGCDQVTFTTAALAEGYAAPEPRATVLGKAADVRHFLTIPPVSATTPTRIVAVANLHALKRLGDLVRAVARLRPSHPTVTLRLVGADESGEGDRLRALAARLDVGAACELVGRHGDVGPDLEASLIFALPSGREGVPTAMLEAMAAARPVVVTDVGHVRTVVREGIDGFVVPVGDVGALTDRLHRLLGDRDLAAAMGRAGRRRAARHDVEHVAARLRAALTRAAGRTVAGASA